MQLVAELGEQRVSLIAIPGTPPLRRLEELGVARVSFGPLSQNVALTALPSSPREPCSAARACRQPAHPQLSPDPRWCPRWDSNPHCGVL